MYVFNTNDDDIIQLKPVHLLILFMTFILLCMIIRAFGLFLRITYQLIKEKMSSVLSNKRRMVVEECEEVRSSNAVGDEGSNQVVKRSRTGIHLESLPFIPSLVNPPPKFILNGGDLFEVKRLNLLKTYVPAWSRRDGCRELIQNLYDGAKDVAMKNNLKSIEFVKNEDVCQFGTITSYTCIGHSMLDNSSLDNKSYKLALLKWEPTSVCNCIKPASVIIHGEDSEDVDDDEEDDDVMIIEDRCNHWNLTLENYSVILDSHIFLIGNSSKNNLSQEKQQAYYGTDILGFSGMHGEGLKVSFVALLREGSSVKYQSNHQIMVTHFDKLKTGQEELCVSCSEDKDDDESKTNLPLDHLRVSVNCLSSRNIEWHKYLFLNNTNELNVISLKRFISSQNLFSPLDGIEILKDDQFVGDIYHRGIFIHHCDFIPFGVHCLGEIKIGRDRNSIVEFSSRSSFLQFLNKFCSQDFIVPGNNQSLAFQEYILDLFNSQSQKIKHRRMYENLNHEYGIRQLLLLLWNACLAKYSPKHFPYTSSKLNTRFLIQEAGHDSENDVFEISPHLYKAFESCNLIKLFGELKDSVKEFRRNLFKQPLDEFHSGAMVSKLEEQLSKAVKKKVVIKVNDLSFLSKQDDARLHIDNSFLLDFQLNEEGSDLSLYALSPIFTNSLLFHEYVVKKQYCSNCKTGNECICIFWYFIKSLSTHLGLEFDEVYQNSLDDKLLSLPKSQLQIDEEKKKKKEKLEQDAQKKKEMREAKKEQKKKLKIKKSKGLVSTSSPNTSINSANLGLRSVTDKIMYERSNKSCEPSNGGLNIVFINDVFKLNHSGQIDYCSSEKNNYHKVDISTTSSSSCRSFHLTHTINQDFTERNDCSAFPISTPCPISTLKSLKAFHDGVELEDFDIYITKNPNGELLCGMKNVLHPVFDLETYEIVIKYTLDCPSDYFNQDIDFSQVKIDRSRFLCSQENVTYAHEIYGFLSEIGKKIAASFNKTELDLESLASWCKDFELFSDDDEMKKAVELFNENDHIPYSPTSIEYTPGLKLFHKMVLLKNGVCSERSFVFTIFAQHLLGLKCHLAFNDVHAFVILCIDESLNQWRRIDLGGSKKQQYGFSGSDNEEAATSSQTHITCVTCAQVREHLECCFMNHEEFIFVCLYFFIYFNFS